MNQIKNFKYLFICEFYLKIILLIIYYINIFIYALYPLDLLLPLALSNFLPLDLT